MQVWVKRALALTAFILSAKSRDCSQAVTILPGSQCLLFTLAKLMNSASSKYLSLKKA